MPTRIALKNVPKLDANKSQIKITNDIRAIAQTPFLHIYSRQYIDKKGKTNEWSYVERPNGREPVSIRIMDANGKFLFIAQPRVPFNKYVISSPAGLRDHPDEHPIAVAIRETKEETGYTITKRGVKSVSDPLPNSAGLTTESTNVVEVVLQKKVSGKATMESSEDIVSFWATPKEFMRLQSQLNPKKILVSDGTYNYMKGFTSAQDQFCAEIKKVITSVPPSLHSFYKKMCI